MVSDGNLEPPQGSVKPKTSVTQSCLPDLLQHQAKRIPDALAILALGRDPLTYGGLFEHVDEMGRKLRALGIGRRDRVAVVLPNGPELAVAILSVEASATCVPLNSSYGVEELERYFAELKPRALITSAGNNSAAHVAAASHGICVLELSVELDAPAGLFALTGDEGEAPPDEPASPDDVALLLPTSGTTSRPKIVPLTHANICTSAHAHTSVLALRETDRCLNVLPLYHGHGLNGTLLASLAAGAGVVCTPKLEVSSFVEWLACFEPTWYSALPIMHQAILRQTGQNPEPLKKARLRFVRSSSAPLPPRIFAELEQMLETPVIEWYGMTEVASSPIACNPLPPGQRKVGSVGLPVNLDVAIVDESGEMLMSGGQTGQVVVRGASITSGYDGNAMATKSAFAGDWFKTGDLGYFDDDGFLFLSGRMRERINRGGNKISPQEIDEVLLDHPEVVEAVTFSVPHTRLGEDVESAVVLQQSSAATAKDIRQFTIGRIADFKVPSQIHIEPAIPKGPTGKVQRVGMGARLGLDQRPRAFIKPRGALEDALSEHWTGILKVERIGRHDNFFSLGGDSLLAVDAVSHINANWKVSFDDSRFFEGPTLAQVAENLEHLISCDQAPQPPSAIPQVPRENGIMPASIAQERLWKLQRALPDIPFMNVFFPLRLTSSVDALVLERSINEIVCRHEILRTTLAENDGSCVQIVAPQLAVPLVIHDLRALPRSRRETLVRQLLQEEVLHSFDLATGPLIRTSLVHLTEQENLLLITMHRVVCDGRSLSVFVNELVALYDAFFAEEESPLAPLPIQYADFAHWQRRWRSQPQIAAQYAFWRDRLSNPLPEMSLTKARTLTGAESYYMERRQLALPASLAEAAERFGDQEGGTLFMVLLGALKTLLHGYLGQDDLCVATNVANRNQRLTKALIGPLVNTVVLRANLGGDPTPREVLRRIRTTTIAALANQDLSFEELVQTFERERQLNGSALTNVMLLLQSESLRSTATSGKWLDFEEANPNMLVPLMTISSSEITLVLKGGANGLMGTCVYNATLFKAKMIDRLIGDFRGVLESMTMDPERPISAIHASLNKQMEEM